ncbi:unnamed protein product [Calypogeia fissa]
MLNHINSAPIETPQNAATQTPDPFQPQDERTPMLTESDGDRSEYQEHFTQSNAKGDKTRKQANRTPTAEVSAVDKLGKKQKKQLQFHEPTASQSAVPAELATTSSRGESRKDDGSKKNKDPAGRAAGPSPQQLLVSSTDNRKGKAAASVSSPGK